eukprot:TRINITY_DN15306_c0_g1_i1.p1 TRINITY_DN15306_c0_g1~~TRINITY_DN15306_c0_g1_i1.p1  ORF type:complete len:189 (-),score=31.13 TRINITY_DN15306_c0_g1_i1:118-684(-)
MEWVFHKWFSCVLQSSGPRKSRNGNQHVTYTVEVTLFDGRSYHIHRRYRQWRLLYEDLTEGKASPHVQDLPVIEKSVFKADSKAIDARFGVLQQFLQGILRHKDMCLSDCVLSFLELNSIFQVGNPTIDLQLSPITTADIPVLGSSIASIPGIQHAILDVNEKTLMIRCFAEKHIIIEILSSYIISQI